MGRCFDNDGDGIIKQKSSYQNAFKHYVLSPDLVPNEHGNRIYCSVWASKCFTPLELAFSWKKKSRMSLGI